MVAGEKKKKVAWLFIASLKDCYSNFATNFLVGLSETKMGKWTAKDQGNKSVLRGENSSQYRPLVCFL